MQTQFIQHSFSTNSNLNRHNLMFDDGPLRIHVGNIPFSWSEKHLKEQFEIFGPVDDVEVVSNAQGSKGFGFLTFLRRRDGSRAMQVKNGTIADGRKITVSLAVAKSHSTSSLVSTSPQTPGRILLTNHSMPYMTKSSSSSLSPDAPMWTPVTPPSSNAWLISPESQSNGWINQSPPLSSSPLSMLFPPLLPSPCLESIENERKKSHWQSLNAEPILNEEKIRCKYCPHCGRSIQ